MASWSTGYIANFILNFETLEARLKMDFLGFINKKRKLSSVFSVESFF